VAAPQKIGDVLSRLISQRGYARTQGVNTEAAIWAEIAGPQLATLTRPGELKRGVWEIFVANNLVVQELTFTKAQLLSQVQAKLPQHQIRDLRFKVGTMNK
jgi:predicted nucleic acid-binding Zn ribbon protein